MKKVKSNKDVLSSKQAIAKQLSQMERELMKSANPLDQVVVLNKAEDILEAEIFHWTQLLEDNLDCTEEELRNLVNSATPHIATLQDLINTISSYRVPLMEGAIKVHKARANSNIKQGYIKHITEA